MTDAERQDYAAAIERAIDAAVEQGLGRTISDPAVLDRAATLFATTPNES
jgi:hypothetical protein